MDDVTILLTDETYDYDAMYKPLPRMRVLWKLGPHGPFTTVFDKATFDGAAARTEIERLADNIRALHR